MHAYQDQPTSIIMDKKNVIKFLESQTKDLSDFKDLKIGKERIDPDTAINYLNLNFKNNRKIFKAKVQELATEMRQGRFKISNNAISFDKNGYLIDGQHRLEAIILSQTTQSFFVARELPIDSIAIMDIGIKRCVSDRITLMGTPISKKEAAVIRHCMMNINRSGVGTMQFAHNRYDKLIQHQFEKHRDFFHALENKKITNNIKYKVFIISAALKIYIEMKNTKHGNSKDYRHNMSALERAFHWLYVSSSPCDCVYPIDPDFDKSASVQYELIMQRKSDYEQNVVGRTQKTASSYWSSQECYKKTIGLAYNFMKGIPTTRAIMVRNDPFGEFSKMEATTSKGF
tara:strand:- start:67 stop:1095 length:1029 start_codon:yes stop_codon:yes gene_type:complete